ncbi:MAG: phosphatase PAP2 family protein [Candidatus Staskawiczbacteria bacterium]|nr:phosphatase PAP2 family protein [Candidatus Staskawiczbacteria bacterium]
MISIFKNINYFAGKSKLLDWFAIFCAKYLLYLMMIFLLAFAYYENNWQAFFYSLLSGLFAAFIIDTIIYVFYKKHRPAELKSAKVLIPIPKNPSFPSRHSSFIFGVSFCLFLYNFPLAIAFIICSCLVGLARVFCGVHWFTDVVAEVFTRFISTFLVYGLINYIRL